MSKAKRILVDWLAEGERGWACKGGAYRWRYGCGGMETAELRNGIWYWKPSRITIADCEADKGRSATEVFPRPAAKPPKVVKVRAWGLIDQWNRLAGVHYTKKYALKMKCRGDTIIPLEGTYTPKRRKP